ncbi:kinesin family member 2/24 [Angomonas deanei]|uniref:Kinesin-like protein n=1 Tax=Angomonas deanei TaxID=59799 RepID=A0A7G2CJE9_9TRYP|nr:kinesin family member 2/24 [Angomonas deanei]CAD2219505.1 Kinesin motor domain/Microtubule binding/TRAF-type zinc finger containing protein, putative [Angomonas deanei]|eukprot:EPY24296.1 kinesin family member 2/24 [Angomonas deanei]
MKRPKTYARYADTVDLLAQAANNDGKGADNNNNNNNNTNSNNIKVAVRKRPMILPREETETDVVRCEADSVAVFEPRTRLDLTPFIDPSMFSFDNVFDEKASNYSVYQSCCQPLLKSVKEGGVAVVFAFGQTGSGKTYTMLGKEEEPGLYGLAVTDLLQMTGPTANGEAPMSASFYEVYGTKLFDLLNDRAELKMLQDENKTIHIVGLTQRPVSTVDDVHALMVSGQQLRAIGTTHANDRSSRSHAVLEIKVKLEGGAGLGRMTFVDLAGSERASDTAETDLKTRREGAEINKSLLALKECIRAMSMRKKHIPFRGSKLTQILRESFDGRSHTCMIATVSPCQAHCEDTLNTLRYADRIKELKGAPGAFLGESPVPCKKCGLPIFPSDKQKHVCRRQNVQCPHCKAEMDKPLLELHLAECKDAPVRCPHCGDRMLRADQPRHLRRCVKAPVKCPNCGQSVSRQLIDRHNTTECTAVKEKCRYCQALFSRAELPAHEQQCDAMKIACVHCLKFIRKRNLETHMQSCLRNPNRVSKTTELPAPRSTSNVNRASSATPKAGSSPSDQTSCPSTPPTGTPNLSALIPLPPLVDGNERSTPQRSSNRSPALQPKGESSGEEESYDSEVQCPYAKYGCPVSVTRLNIAAHLTEAVAEHLEYVTTYADRTDRENAELRKLVVKRNFTPANKR